MNQIKKILLMEWDPIGINTPRDKVYTEDDEYDRYARDLENILTRAFTDDEVENYLLWAEHYIGIDVSIERVKRVLKRILETCST